MSTTRKDEDIQSAEEEDVTLRQLRSAGAFTISPELFEKVRENQLVWMVQERSSTLFSFT